MYLIYIFSGRQSLTRLATFISQLQLFQIQLTKTYGNNEFREDMKKLMLKAGLMKIESVFLFSDTQVITIITYIEIAFCFFELPILYRA